jgi:hypothetical protein
VQVGAGFLKAAEEGERSVGIQMAFMKLIEDDDGSGLEFRVSEGLASKNSLGEVAEAGVRSRDVFEADLKADGLAERFVPLEGHAARG